MSELPRKADGRDIEPARRWLLSSVWDIEKQRIGQWIQEEASHRLAEPFATAETAKRAAGAVVENIRLGFVSDDETRDQKLIGTAGTGQLEREAGSLGLVKMFRFFLLLALICEIGFFVVLYFLGLGNPFLVLQGIMLAAGGFAAGAGLFSILDALDEKRRNNTGIYRHNLTGWLPLGGGLLIIFLILWLRAGDGQDAGAILAFTSALAVSVVILTCYYKSLATRYDHALQRMYLAQRWFSSDQHKKACETYWKEEFCVTVDALARRGREILDGSATAT